MAIFDVYDNTSALSGSVHTGQFTSMLLPPHGVQLLRISARMY
jgi:hypothetical protein|eukprot:COSAG06_NODE_2175_length_7411_cov_86.745897_2_plen_43_part_00